MKCLLVLVICTARDLLLFTQVKCELQQIVAANLK
jgi:hypothetical protein